MRESISHIHRNVQCVLQEGKNETTRLIHSHSPLATYSNFNFLEGLETDFTKEYKESRIAKAKALGLQKKFLPSIRSKMHYYNTNHTKLCREQKVQNMLDKIDDMKTVLNKNIRLLVRRQEEQLDDMLELSTSMKRDSVVFKKRAEVLLVSQKRKRAMQYCFMTTFGLGLCYLLLAAGCGFTLAACREKQPSS